MHTHDEGDYSDMALALVYVVTAAVLVAIYREPLCALARETSEWYRRQWAAQPLSIRWFRGKLWEDVRKAVDDAG
jgi:hypothetical protein